MSKAKGREMNNRIRGLSLIQDWPHTTLVPQDFLSDPRVSAGAKVLFMLYCHHTPEKVPLEALAKELGCHKSTILRYEKILEREGWIAKKRGGRGKPRHITLFMRKRLKAGRTGG